MRSRHLLQARPDRFLLALLVALATSAGAQDPPSEDLAIEEIVVTAQGRGEQLLSDVPINMSAYSGEELADLGIFTLEGVGQLTPGVLVQNQSPNNPAYNIRGITTDDGSAQFEPRVALYYNGVNISRSRGSFLAVHDMERIEVLKGPQSTLFSRSAEIGAISYISKRPGEDFDAGLKLQGGNYSYFLADAYLNIPITDWLSSRIAVFHNEREGYIDNLSGGTLNGIGSTSVRGSLRATPTDDLTFDLILTYQKDDQPGTSFKGVNLPTIGSNTSPFTAADLERGKELGLDRDVYNATFIATWQLNDVWQLTSNSSFHKFDSNEAFDADGSASPALFFREIAEGEQFNQELKASFDFADWGLDGFFGVNYFYEDGSQNVPLVLDDATVVPIGLAAADDVPGLLYNPTDGFVQNGNSTLFEFTNFGTTNEFDIWADATYNLIDALDLTVGIRGIFLWKESKYIAPDAVSQPGTSCPGFGDNPCSLLFDVGGLTSQGELRSRTGSFNQAVGRAIFNYDFEERFDQDINVFAGWNRGWRPDVIMVEARSDEIVPGETVDSAEIGAKANFFDNRLNLEGSFYYYWYKNFQINIFDREQLDFVTENGGDATGIGVELAGNAQITEEFSTFANYAWTRPRFEDDISITQGDEEIPIEGATFRLTPEHTFVIGGQWVQDLTENWDFYMRSWFTWQSEVFFLDTNDPALRQGSYGLWNARIGADYNLDIGTFGIAVWGFNMLDKRYVIDGGNTGNQFGLPTFIAGPPATFGGEVSYRF